MKLIITILLVVLIFSKNVFAGPKVSILNSPIQINKNEEFTVTFNAVDDVLSSDSYYIKGRVGSSSASMNQGETFNPTSSNWLSDTASWSTFSTIAFSNSSIATSTVTLRTKSTAFTGNNLLLIRLNRNSTSYDSPSNALLVLEPLTPTIAPTDIPISPITPTETLAPSPSAISSLLPTPVSYSNIYISEAMVNPATGEKEWVEIYNNNDFPVSLNNWFIDDLENAGSSPKIFSLEINAKGYGIFDLTSSMFNNDGDSVRLLDFNKNLKDDFEYRKTEQRKTLGRTWLDSDDFCLQEFSKNSANNPCINPTPTMITSITTGQINLSPTTNIMSTKTPIYTGQARLTPTILTNQTGYYSPQSNVLGLSTKINHNNSSLINLLSIISISYSLLTIISILIKSKVLKKYVLVSYL